MADAVAIPRLHVIAAALLASALVACSDEGTAPPGPTPDAGTDADAADAGPDAGPLPSACNPGERELADGTCEPAGVPPSACGEGFEPTGDGSCRAVLPPSPCGFGQMAIPGETDCRDVAPCSSNRWGDAPVDGSTQYVDGSYSGGASDGSETDPWTSIQEAVDAAEPGAVVAITTGSYLGDVLIYEKPVRLWGKCPGEVEIVGATGVFSTVYIAGANDAEVHDVAITGTEGAVTVHNAVGVLLDRVWLHDTYYPGLDVHYLAEPAQVTLRRSLVERTANSGAEAWRGAELVVEESCIRDAQAMEGWSGWGLNGIGSEADNRPSRLEVRRSLIERNLEVGIQALSCELVVEDSVVRNTQPSEGDQIEGMGILVTPYMDDTAVRTVEIRRSVVEENHMCGVCVVNADTTVVHTAIRDTAPQVADGRRGYGLLLASDVLTEEERPTAFISFSTVENNFMLGIGLGGIDATIEGTLVRDVASEEVSGVHGRGLVAEINPDTGIRSRLECTGSAVERSHEVGLLVLGSDAVLDGVAVRDTGPRPWDRKFGRGVIVQFAAETLDTSTVTVEQSLIADSHEAAFYVSGADVALRDTVVQRTSPQQMGETFGDGVIAMTLQTVLQPMAATLEVERCRIEQNARAGVASFGATVGLGATIIDCNTLDLAGEAYENQPFDITDRGSNVCGCADQTRACQVLSTGLLPPDPLQ